MTALAAAQNVQHKPGLKTRAYLMKASTQIWKGGLVMKNTSGTAEPAAKSSTGHKVVGVARESLLSTAAGAEEIEVDEGTFLLTAATLAQADSGRPVYVVDDDSVDETPDLLTIPAGFVEEYVGASQAWTRVTPYISASFQPIIQWHTIWQGLAATLADGDQITTWTPGFVGEILGMDAWATVAVTTASKASTLNLEIGTTDLTGGVLALTSANLTPIGALVSATAITAGSVFGQADTISLLGTATTTFSEGEVLVRVKARQFVGAAV